MKQFYVLTVTHMKKCKALGLQWKHLTQSESEALQTVHGYGSLIN